MSERYLAWVYPEQFDGPFEPSGVEVVYIAYEAAAVQLINWSHAPESSVSRWDAVRSIVNAALNIEEDS